MSAKLSSPRLTYAAIHKNGVTIAARLSKYIIDALFSLKMRKRHKTNSSTGSSYLTMKRLSKTIATKQTIAEKICKSCVDNDFRCSEVCQTLTFSKNLDFCRWLFDQKHFIGIAHNLKGYDGCFLLQYILENHTPDYGEPSIIPNGTKIMSITYRCVKVIDSYSFLPVGLDKLPKMFGIKELKKGFFPHEFNRPENFDYVGSYPPKESYGYRFFSQEKMIEFDHWYASKHNEEFNFQNELESYCLSDVKVLSAAVLAFRKIIMQITQRDADDPGVDPWQSSITIASLCHLIYRRNMMSPGKIAFIPEYDSHRNTS